MSLKSDLQEISGVGEKTAEKIIEVVEENQTAGVSERELERLYELLERGSDRVAQSRIEDLL